MHMATPSPAGEHRSTSRITTNDAERGAADTGRAAVVGAKLHAEQAAIYGALNAQQTACR